MPIKFDNLRIAYPLKLYFKDTEYEGFNNCLNHAKPIWVMHKR
jgi:hypothetical protein